VIILVIANNKKILGSRTNGLLANTLGITITGVMGVAALAFVWSLIF